MTLRAVVVGTGFAGEGHTRALREAGVEVVAMCGRTPGPAKAMAKKLGVESIRFDWQQALGDLKPDIVTLATPAASHWKMTKVAAELGCHIVCDKPLAVGAPQARDMLVAVESAGVKHAYGATSSYAPAVVHTRNLLADSFIGEIQEIESVMHIPLPPLLPFHWLFQANQGGGMLNNIFTHTLGQILCMTDAEVVAAGGEARYLVDRAPVVETFHDSRDPFEVKVEEEQVEEWGEVDADTAYTVMTQLRMPQGNDASACFQASVRSNHPHPNFTALHGTKGTLYLTGGFNAINHIQHYCRETATWQDVEVPQTLIESLPEGDDPPQRWWKQLFREFVADVRSGDNSGYPNFHDGWIASEIIDIVISGRSLTSMPGHPADISRDT